MFKLELYDGEWHIFFFKNCEMAIEIGIQLFENCQQISSVDVLDDTIHRIIWQRHRNANKS